MVPTHDAACSPAPLRPTSPTTPHPVATVKPDPPNATTSTRPVLDPCPQISPTPLPPIIGTPPATSPTPAASASGSRSPLALTHTKPGRRPATASLAAAAAAHRASTSPETPTPSHRVTPARATLPNCPATGTGDSSAIARGLVKRRFSRAGYTRNSPARRVRSDLSNPNCDAQHSCGKPAQVHVEVHSPRREHRDGRRLRHRATQAGSPGAWGTEHR